MSGTEVGPAVAKLIALSTYQVSAYEREGHHVRSYTRGGGSGKPPATNLRQVFHLKSDADPFSKEAMDWGQGSKTPDPVIEREGHGRSYLRGGGEHMAPPKPGSLKALLSIKPEKVADTFSSEAIKNEAAVMAKHQKILTDPVTGPTADWEGPGGWSYKKMIEPTAHQIDYLKGLGWEVVSSFADSVPGHPDSTLFKRKQVRKPVAPVAAKPKGFLAKLGLKKNG